MASYASLRPLLAPLLILLAGGGLLVGLVLTRPQPPVPEPKKRPTIVTTQSVYPHTASPHLPLYGRLESPHRTTLTAAVAARVRSVPAQEGRFVSRGQPLVRLARADQKAILEERQADLAEVEARIEEAKAQHEGDQAIVEQRQTLLDLAQRELQRAKRLVEREMGSPADLDAARQALEQAQLARTQAQQRVQTFSARLQGLKAQRRRARARVGRAQRDLARTRIEAPFGGRVLAVEVAPGDRVRVGDPIVRVYDTEVLEVRAAIPGSSVAPVRRAMEADRTVSAEVTVDDRTFRARLDRFGGRAREGATGIEGLFRLVGAYPRDVRLGRLMKLKAALPSEPGVVAVPFSALYDRNRIFAVREGRLVGFRVERVGQRLIEGAPDQALVRSERLRAGERVVTIQLPNAREGLAVRVTSSAEARP